LIPIRVEGTGVWIEVEEIRAMSCFEHVCGESEPREGEK